ncbi:MAG: hypothetical protein JXB14_08435 [Candidatus Altiarchaeota archaeon]|nr:hypothetical protein [Candidatus Altiarchaeota archaeon]
MIQDRFIEQVSQGVGLVKKLRLFELFLPLTVVFLLFSLILILFGEEFYYAAIPTAFVAVALTLKKIKGSPIRSLEGANPKLRERLRTAYDNRQSDNFIVRDLMRDVSEDLLNMDTDRLLNLQRATLYISLIIILIFLLLAMVFVGFEGIPGLGGSSSNYGGSGGAGGGGSDSSGGGGGGSGGDAEKETSPEMGAGMGGPKNIYSDVSMATIEGEELELELHPEYGGENRIGSEKPKGQEALGEVRSTFVQSTAAESYTENIPTRVEEIVRNYFQKLTEE